MKMENFETERGIVINKWIRTAELDELEVHFWRKMHAVTSALAYSFAAYAEGRD
jgi:hypothetical protein